MLHSHLIAKTAPVASAENIILWGNYRVTVLSSRLFRLERSDRRCFRDAATQSVWFRNMPPQTFSVTEEEGALRVATDAVTLILRDGREDCRVLLNGKELPIGNDQNLKGTARTLDRHDGNLKITRPKKIGDRPTVEELVLCDGVCSRSGVAVIEDTASLTLGENGEVIGERGDGSDEYIFAFGDDYLGAVRALYMITGSTPLVPRFALGNWWSRYHAYTDAEYLRVLNRFEERNVPLTVATVDMDWHWSTTLDERKGITADGKNTEEYGGANGWTGYSWNTDLFPDYKRFLREVKKKNLKITLNLHPALGVRYFEDCYEQMARAMGVDPESCLPVHFDISDPTFINNYFSVLHRPYEQDGVDFWWIDWQQGNESRLAGLDPLWALNHYHYLDNCEGHSSPLILSRYAGIGSHRYPLGFSGDTHVTWRTLDYLPYFTLTASNVGYSWWSHDVGGHYNGIKDGELFARHVQLGVFSPITRLHCTSGVIFTKEPTTYKNGVGLIVEEWLRLRHKMIPLLYTASHKTAAEGTPLVEPLYYRWKNEAAYRMKNQFLFAGQLLVAPVTTPLERDGYAATNVFLPEGVWTDIFTGDEYVSPKDGMEKTLYRPLDSIPTLIAEGGILPLSADEGNSTENPTVLDVLIYNGNGTYELFEDGRTQNSTAECRTQLTAAYSERDGIGTQKLTLKMTGDPTVLPEKRTIRPIFKSIAPDGEVTVTKNGVLLPQEPTYRDYPTASIVLDDPSAVYEVSVVFPLTSRLEKQKASSVRVLTEANGGSIAMWELYGQIQAAESSTDLFALIRTYPHISDGVRARLLEIF